MAKSKQTEKIKTTIGGQALIEGIMMRGPEKDAIVCRGKDGLSIEVSDRKVYPRRSPMRWPLIRGVVSFFDAQITGVKAVMHSADLSPEEGAEESTSKFDQWLEKKMGSEKFRNLLVSVALVISLALSIGLFFLLPMTIKGLLDNVIPYPLLVHFIEGVIRVAIFLIYMILMSRMKDMKRVFAYHGAEHKTIRCYELGLPLTVENVREQTRKHPRCGTSFLLVVIIISTLVFTVATTALHKLIPALEAMPRGLPYNLIMIGCKLALLPVVVAISYEINRFLGRHDNWFTRIFMAPGIWFQNFTTNEPDDSMIEVGIAALEAVLPSQEGADKW